jgi:hypothetical protein
MKNVSEKIKQHLILDVATAFAPVGVLECDKNGNPCGIRFPDQCLGEATIRISYDGERVGVHAVWPMSKLPENKHNYSTMVTPRDLRDGSECESIYMAATKSPKVIVAEIMRRYLPGYLPVLSKCIAQRNANDAYTTNKASAIETVKRAAKIGNTPATAYGCTVAVPEGHFIVDSADNINAQLHLTLANTLKLIEFLKTLS